MACSLNATLTTDMMVATQPHLHDTAGPEACIWGELKQPLVRDGSVFRSCSSVAATLLAWFGLIDDGGRRATRQVLC
jgi:hypothetical protein